MASRKEECLAIGIDLGTTYSCVAVWRSGQNHAEIITNSLGNRTTPSLVAFTPIQRLVGEAARNQARTNTANTIFESKRLIGRRFNDETVQNDIKFWPFKVVAGIYDRPMISVTYKDEEKQFSCEEISSMILQKMKGIADTYLSTKVNDAVITVPAYFNDSQRQATKNAGQIAGLNVLRILSEPTAAAMAYKLHTKSTVEKNVLVFDLGGGTFDVSLVFIKNDVFKIKAIAGDTHLGGADFDNRMVSHFITEIQRKHKKDISANPRALARLRDACEKAKRDLSTNSNTTIEIDSLFDGIDFSSSITRACFEQMNMDLFKKCMDEVEKCLKDAKMKKKDIHDVVLVGGSSRIPKIEGLLKDLFNKNEFSKCINQDEAIAYGAAFYAAVLTGVDKEVTKNVVVMDVTPLSLEFYIFDGNMGVVIPRNTPIPTNHVHTFATNRDNQTFVSFHVYEGERPSVQANHLLGKFKLHEIPSAPKGVAKFDACFKIDDNGILKVSANHVGRKSKKEIRITNNCGRLSEEEINEKKKMAVKYLFEEEERRNAYMAKNALEEYIFSISDNLSNNALKIGLVEKEKIERAIEKTMQWIEMSNMLVMSCEFEKKMCELKRIFGALNVRFQ